MALDTVRIRSPYIEPELAARIYKVCQLRQGVQCSTGEILYEITTADLRGSYDSRISIQVKRHDYSMSLADGIPLKIDTPPYLEIECSLHKLFLGHNVYGGTEDFHGAIAYLIDFVERFLDAELPHYGGWMVLRADWSYVFNMRSAEAVQEFFYLMRNAHFPRRKPSIYHTGIYFPGTTTTVKFYGKGNEFDQHDFKKLRKLGYNQEELAELRLFAHSILRVEVEIKQKKMKYDRVREPLVSEVDGRYFEKIYESEVSKIMKECQQKAIYRTAHEVEKAIFSYYQDKPKLAKTLLSYWTYLSTFGEDEFARTHNRKTAWRIKKQLTEAGVSWNLTDVKENLTDAISEVPKDFLPVKDSSYRIVETNEKIQKAINNIMAKKNLMPSTNDEHKTHKNIG